MPFVLGGVDNLKIKLQIVDKLIILQEGDRSLEELQARTALLNIMNIEDRYQYANNLSKKRKAISMLDEENMRFKSNNCGISRCQI